MYRTALVGLLIGSALAVTATGCASETAEEEVEGSDNALVHRARDLWIYDGPLPSLEAAQVTISLKGHTARVSGLLPAGSEAPDLPHLKSKTEGGRVRVDVVYPIATGAQGGYNARPGNYAFTHARPYRPDGQTTSSSGTSFVTWGGFPFVAYAGNIAVHGPITHQANASGADTFYLKRGTVSHGCNRMNGEHVTELAHLVGVNMRKVWVADQIYSKPASPDAKVNLIADYDSYDGKPIDVDYATDVGVTRPQGSVMFGSWAATETPDGSDLPPDMKWEGGVAGKPYVFREHALQNMVCSVPEARVKALRAWASGLPGAELPKGFCEKKACVLDTLKAGGDPKAKCGL